LDNRGFPDQSDEYDHYLLHSIDGGTVLRKLQHPMPDLNGPIDPSFDHPFIPDEHEETLKKKVDVSHLHLNQQTEVYDLIREFWPVFDERGVFIPVKNYECVIDTGTACPIAVKKIFYGKRETVIMRRCISALAKSVISGKSGMGDGCLKPYSPPSPTKSTPVTSKTLFGAFLSITSHSTALLAS